MKASTDTILLTGFEPFGGESINPSAEIARRLDGIGIGDRRIVAAILPVAFATAAVRLERLLETHRPGLAVALGQGGGRSGMSLERIAVNLIDARIPDNDGAQPIDAPVIANAPVAYFSTLPLKAMRADLAARGIPAALSHSAGSFVCNQVFYALAHWAAHHAPTTRCGFIHLPWLPEQATAHAGDPSMALDTMLTGVTAALECALATTGDLHTVGGKTH
ncbi:MAG TPA: pyroglutamyl-peptidase I [Rhodanobacteraceae bacterium]|nr:pyroglutamyl-peptidase I [Rhodanobacteraceae bacterium]